MLRFFMPLLLLALPASAYSWGFYAHSQINRLAVFCIPEGPLLAFYKQHINWVADHAPDADKRRYMVADEACRHYIDVDRYEHAVPIDSIPYFWKDAVARYGEDTLRAHGIAPWQVNLCVYQLTEAFRKKDIKRILRLSADLGHYTADSHVPLHTTRNYNGQLTGQKGIHGLWESRLPELFAMDYDYWVGAAGYIPRVQSFIWAAVNGSYAAVDSVLFTERSLSAYFPDDRKYVLEIRGSTQVRTYSPEFCRQYHYLLNNMVERRMRAAIQAVASLWYTAWVNAGMPDLPLETALTDLPDTEMEKRVKDGKMIGREE